METNKKPYARKNGQTVKRKPRFVQNKKQPHTDEYGFTEEELAEYKNQALTKKTRKKLASEFPMPEKKKRVWEEQPKPERVYTAVYKAQRSCELLEFLLRKCGTSRNNVKTLLTNKQVVVNGAVVSQYNYLLAKDDEIKIAKHPVTDLPTKQVSTRKAVKPMTIDVIYEDEDFIAINKPCGLLSVQSDKETESAYLYVLDYLSQKNKLSRPYILHRIDKETSGVLVFAKNVKIHSMLKMHWNEQVKLREYYAVVDGKFDEKQGTIVSYLKENQNNLVYISHDLTGQKAITHYEVKEESALYSLLKVEIETGRKNQIRVQMQDKGHPVVGDDKYGKPTNPLGRLGLHASTLTFEHPVTHKEIEIHASVPRTFYALFQK